MSIFKTFPEIVLLNAILTLREPRSENVTFNNVFNGEYEKHTKT